MNKIEAATLAILGIPATFHAIIAEADGAMPGWIGSATQISAFGLVAWIVYYMFTRWLPDMQKSYSDQLAAQREAHTDAMKAATEANAQAVQSMTTAFADSLKSQRSDLLSVRECRAPRNTMPT